MYHFEGDKHLPKMTRIIRKMNKIVIGRKKNESHTRRFPYYAVAKCRVKLKSDDKVHRFCFLNDCTMKAIKEILIKGSHIHHQEVKISAESRIKMDFVSWRKGKTSFEIHVCVRSNFLDTSWCLVCTMRQNIGQNPISAHVRI